MLKKELRKTYRAKRAGLTPKEMAVNQDLLLIQFQQLDIPFVEAIHTYIPVSELREPDPQPLIDWLQFRNPGMVCAAPVADFAKGLMKHLVINDNTEYLVNQYGVAEPADGIELDASVFDIIFVPLLAFDLNGYRVGYGKGFYDRFLAECRPDAMRIGLSFFDAVEKISDTNNFDQRLDYCITPGRNYEF